ncbi:MAG TPA: ABC transporter ATP-binding protein, partial [Acidobacteria bacterium]|nr:ABC transporter ATP-binding protein [Acidobacteriota bacterium]
GLVRPEGGTVRVFGADPVREPVAARRRLGLLPDRPALPAELTVRELLLFRAAFYGIRRRAAETAADRVAAELGVDGLLDRRAGTLSHGQAQRAALAAVLLPAPPLILVDEPMTALDLEAQTVVRAALLRRAERGAAVLMTTHTVGHVAALADRVLRMDRGRIAAVRAGTRDVEELERWILDASS